MKFWTIFFISVSLAVATSAQTTFYTGVKNGGYDAAASTTAIRLQQRGVEVVIENKNGSDEITLAVCNNPNSMGLTQLDAIWKRETQDGCFLPVVGTHIVETAMMFTPPDSDINELSDLTASSNVFVGGVGSGSELTFRNMQFIEKEHGRGNEWSDARVVTGDWRRVQALAVRGQVDAVVMVAATDSRSASQLLSAGWSSAELWDRDINDLTTPQGEVLYEPYKYTDANGDKEWGYKVPSFYVVNQEIELNNLDFMDAVLSALTQ